MRTVCPSCHTIFEVSQLSAGLIVSLFKNVAQEIYILCDHCGDEVTKGYKDTYGLGV